MKINDTRDKKYADYLINAQNSGWKSKLGVQRPYQNYLKRLNLGVTLDIGCGIGRNLKSLSDKSVGIDHNKFMISNLRENGFNVYETNEFDGIINDYKNYFDSILLAHVIEHLETEDAKSIINKYRGLLKKQGKILIICPQIKGFGKDSTHIQFHNLETISKLLESMNLKVKIKKSFPFPEFVGKYFAPNEYWVLASTK